MTDTDNNAGSSEAVAAIPPHIDLAHDDVPCRECGFNLRGLVADGRCPECGTRIAKSISGNLLIHAGASYLASLHRGAMFILISWCLQLMLSFIAMLLDVAFRFEVLKSRPGSAMEIVSPAATLVNLPLAMLGLWGWWMFSAPDPGQRGGDTGEKPRRIVRISTIVLACSYVIAAIAQVTAMLEPAVVSILVGAMLIGGAAAIAQFFASMLYVRWLAPRIPDPAIEARAHQYMWLLPLIYVAGSCIAVGPFIATIMYLILLNRVRVKIQEIRNEAQESEALSGAMA